jgi:hypothetical protein
MYGAQSVEDASARKQKVQRALIDYGQVPDFSGTGLDPNFLGSDVTDLVRSLAQSNTTAGLSQTARFEHDHAINQRQIQDQLAARGMLQSGELPYQIGEEGLQYKQLQYGAQQQLIDYINGANAAYAQGERDRSMGLYSAQHDAAIRQQDLAFQQQQAAADLAYQQQSMAQDQAANAAAQASYDQYTQQQQAPAGAVAPSAQQIAQMAAAVPRKATQRTPAELALFNQFAQWRAENPNWWK